ncbi:WD40 repeat-like protein [Aaosphaeria arxii CBS 175.79]|uniref:WD40 repeat-like protein n=1 Tax=Aaosphaeria arxii CBS 175.79 TaxID=1450172 RepID=A0A6A5XQT2_9PLEO|nr:WD40 repeat-like protein [Aaosphaeria arxii CBS 175.79]KAF2015645.1 WD40 repeat-like protein [Aaosphaeria arxii CBS 175.79]
MNTRPVLDSSSGPFGLSVSFNADNSCFSVALENGFRIYMTKSGDMNSVREVGGGIGCAEMVGRTNYIALVGGGKQPKFPQNKVCPQRSEWIWVDADGYKVQIWNDSKQIVSTSLEFKTPIQRVRISTSHLVVVLLNKVGIYKMKVPPDKLAEYETVNNPFGLCSLGKKIVAFPGMNAGQVRLFDLTSGNISIINAHNSPLRALALNRDDDMVATASEQGTLVRLWSFPSCTKFTEYRRGVDPAAIFSIAFSPSGLMLAVTSDKSTLHIFNVEDRMSDTDPKQHKWGILSKVPLLPRQFSDHYSNATAKFEMGEEPDDNPVSRSATFNAGIPGVPGGKPPKGVVGWTDENTIFVVGAGSDARWEKFIVGVNSDGRRIVYREGWKKYLE